ncbi:MAG: FtsQ-type POTRA domain-containing protein [Nitrospiraceae bacterium]|nr:MAG: FtsQ-type POTRA domain-containing protein [Nitrospiraceae bacterium]
MIKRVRPNRKRNPGARSPRAGKGLLVGVVLWLALLAAVGAGGWYGWRQAGPDVLAWADQFFEIRVVEITRTERISRADVLAMLDLEPGLGLLRIDLVQAQRSLETHPWIRRATVRRVLPDTLVVDLDEREPVAVLRTGAGREFLLDREGTLISEGVPAADEGLPILTGVDYADAILGTGDTVARVRSGIALAGLLDRSGVGRTEVDLRRPGDLVVYYSGLRLRFGEGDFGDKVDRYRQVSDRVVDRWVVQAKAAPARQVEVDLRFQDKVIVREGR